jgi:hypothetical protein
VSRAGAGAKDERQRRAVGEGEAWIVQVERGAKQRYRDGDGERICGRRTMIEDTCGEVEHGGERCPPDRRPSAGDVSIRDEQRDGQDRARPGGDAREPGQRQGEAGQHRNVATRDRDDMIGAAFLEPALDLGVETRTIADQDGRDDRGRLPRVPPDTPATGRLEPRDQTAEDSTSSEAPYGPGAASSTRRPSSSRGDDAACRRRSTARLRAAACVPSAAPAAKKPHAIEMGKIRPGR